MKPWEPIDKLEARAFDDQARMMTGEGQLPDEEQKYRSVLVGFDLDDPYGRSVAEVITGEGREADEELGRMIVKTLKRAYGDDSECPRCDGPLYVDRFDAAKDVAHCDDCGAEIPGNVYREIMGLKDKQSGAGLIAAERMRQIQKEGFAAEHDAAHDSGELARAAICYALNAVGLPVTNAYSTYWPWDARWWKPKTPLQNLIRAGALIAAEIDRLQRQKTEVDLLGQFIERYCEQGAEHECAFRDFYDCLISKMTSVGGKPVPSRKMIAVKMVRRGITRRFVAGRIRLSGIRLKPIDPDKEKTAEDVTRKAGFRSEGKGEK